MEPSGAHDSPQYSHRSQDCHFASPSVEPECSDKEPEPCGSGQRLGNVADSPRYFVGSFHEEGDQDEARGRENALQTLPNGPEKEQVKIFAIRSIVEYMTMFVFIC